MRGTQVKLKKHSLAYFWLLLILQSFIYSVNAFSPIQTNSKITFLFPFYSGNILQKTMNNLGAVSYTYMKEQEFTVLTFQSK